MRSHTDAIYFPFQSPYTPLANSTVAVLTQADAQKLWGTDVDFDELRYSVPEIPDAEWQAMSQMTETGRDGGFDFDLVAGTYWVCLDENVFGEDDPGDFLPEGCVLADLGDGEVLFSNGPDGFWADSNGD